MWPARRTTNSFTAGQAELLERALTDAGIEPRQVAGWFGTAPVSPVQAHGPVAGGAADPTSFMLTAAMMNWVS
jgi:hypothetical protein